MVIARAQADSGVRASDDGPVLFVSVSIGDHRVEHEVSAEDAESGTSAGRASPALVSELAAPLLSLGLIPRQVGGTRRPRAATHAGTGGALLIYPEGEAIVCAIAEDGKLSFAPDAGFIRSVTASAGFAAARLERGIAGHQHLFREFS